MRGYKVAVPLIAIVASSVAYAHDVEYNLCITNVSEFPEPNQSKPFSEVVKDRVWDAKGVEERIDAAAPVVTSLPTDPPRVRIVHEPAVVHVSYSFECSEPAFRAPDWIDDGLWPKTKEVLHYGNEPRHSPSEPSDSAPSGFAGFYR